MFGEKINKINIKKLYKDYILADVYCIKCQENCKHRHLEIKRYKKTSISKQTNTYKIYVTVCMNCGHRIYSETKHGWLDKEYDGVCINKFTGGIQIQEIEKDYFLTK